MNIFKQIREQKDKFENYRDNKQQQKAINIANELELLKKKRIIKEGRAKIYNEYEQEKLKLKKAKETLRKQAPAYKIIKSIQGNLKKVKKGKNFGKLEMGSMFK